MKSFQHIRLTIVLLRRLAMGCLRRKGTAAELMEKLPAGDFDADRVNRAKGLGKRISSLWPHIRVVFPGSRREMDRKGFIAADPQGRVMPSLPTFRA